MVNGPLKRRTGVSSVDIWGNTSGLGDGDVRAINVDIDGKLVLASTSYINVHTGGGQGRKTIGTPGSEEALAASTVCKKVVVSALFSNNAVVYVGFNGVVALAGSETGTPLYPGDRIEISIDNLATIFVDVRTAGNGVTYLYFT